MYIKCLSKYVDNIKQFYDIEGVDETQFVVQTTSGSSVGFSTVGQFLLQS